jgi:hypothetical protein
MLIYLNAINQNDIWLRLKIEKYVLEVIIFVYREVIPSLSPNELETISF